MTYQFARINLSQTHYKPLVQWKYLLQPDLDQLNQIYQTYCRYKKFASVRPLFASEYTDINTDVIGYYDCDQLVAFSLIKRYDQTNAMCSQFAWTYHQPSLRLGIKSLQAECAIYKDRGFEYLYLDQAHLYKQSITGFELLGPI
jgi:hypothetical protein